MTENFIRIYDNILSDRLVDNLIKMASDTVTWNNRNDVDKSDFQVPLDPFWPALVRETNESLLNRGLVSYLNDFPYLKHFSWNSGVMLLQKTELLQGYHTFHSENVSWHSNNRTLAWMIYLNDVEEGGETEFLYQKRV